MGDPAQSGTTFKFFVLNGLPVPRTGIGVAAADRAAELAARLASVDNRFRSFAEACGVSVGSLNEQAKRDTAIAELDAVVAAMYGLNAIDLETIFDDFTLNAVPASRREAVRKHFQAVRGATA